MILKFKITFKRKNDDCLYSFIWEYEYYQMHKMGETPLLIDVRGKVDDLLLKENGSSFDKIISIEDLNEPVQKERPDNDA